ncbi:MAG: hypothetical protein M5U25_07910 [Planctomycetota bacterium]|nr:hypothetical protein [Planctomycetota bacterium]
MRWILLLALLAGCATQRPEPATPPIWTGEGIEYELTRQEPAAVLTADLTLVELDEACAKSLLGIEDHTDIAPRSFKQPMGEIAAVNAMEGHGELLARPSLALAGGDVSYEFSREHLYLREWSGDTRNSSPLFETITEGVVCTLKVAEVNGGRNVTLESVSAQMNRPITRFIETPPIQGHPVNVPEISAAERVATETLRPGETAMFQLSRASYEDTTRIRLLFVRLRGS